jgi:hypothetical protein
MPSAFLWDDRVSRAAFIGDLGASALATLPLSNIIDPQPRLRARWSPARCSVWVDFGGVTSVGVVAVISTTLGIYGGSPGGPTIRVRVGNDAGFSFTNWDSTTLDVETDDTANGNVVIVPSPAASGRYMRVDVEDFYAPVLDIGRIIAGPLWNLPYAHSYGITEGRLILDRRDRNPFTGAEFPVPAAFNPRATTFTLNAISRDDAIAQHRNMLHRLGAVGEALWIPDTTLAQQEMNQRCIFGAIAEPGSASLLARSNFVFHSRAFSITERM